MPGCKLDKEEPRRKIPKDTPLDFVSEKWKPYVIDSSSGKTSRCYYELCVLWELRNALRTGNVWTNNSRRYANPNTYLIPPAQWPALRQEVCQLINAPQDGSVRLKERNEPRTKELSMHLYASILAQACNFGLEQMAQITDISYRRLAWCTTWYIREETLKSATTALVNHHCHQHTTDTAGYSELIFTLFDLLGLRFSPRIRDLEDQCLYRMDSLDPAKYKILKQRIKGVINQKRILEHWDDLPRVAGSLKLGWVTASLLIQKLQSSPQKSALTKALQEYGRIPKTIHILRWYESEENRRRINRQLNKGEALHGLRSFLCFANKGFIRRRYEDELKNQVGCLNLVTNAVIIWNTAYISAVVEQLKAEGYPVQESDLEHLWPTRYNHINVHGKYRFNIDEVLNRKGLRPLRQQIKPL